MIAARDVKRVTVLLVGAVICNAIKDYKSEYLKNNRSIIWEDARDFLFKRNKLETFLSQFAMRDAINCTLLRKKIKSRKFNLIDNE